MVRNLLLLMSLSIAVLLTGCGGFQTLSSSSSSGDSSLAAISAALKAGGLTDEEVSAIEDSIEDEVGSSSLSVKQKASASADKIPDMIRAAMKALGLGKFSSTARKKLAIKLISREILLVFKDDLKGYSADKLEDLIEECIEEQFKASSSSGLTGTDREESMQDIIKNSMSASEEFCEGDDDKQQAVMRSLANGSISQLSAAGLNAAEIGSMIPKIVDAGLSAVSNLSGSADKKEDLELEFILRSFDSLNNSGVATADMVAVSNNISTVVNAAVAVTSPARAQVETIKDENKACSESAKFVYMFEYSDSRCQTLARKYVMGPMPGSPMNKGYPNHGFCFLDPSTNLYYNWIGAPAGCSNTPPAFTTFPAVRPSPRNLTSGTIASKCSWMFSTGGGGGSDGTQAACESNALVNFKSNGSNKHTEVVYSGKMIAIFDVAPTGLTLPAISKMCQVADFDSGIVMHDFYSRDSNECLAQCRDIVSDHPQYKYLCKFDSALIKTYLANEVPAKVTVPITKRLKLTAPQPLPRNECVRVAIELDNLAGVIQPGNGQAIGFYTSQVLYPLGVGVPLTYYSNSTCSTPVSVPSLPMGAEPRYYYVKVDSAATSVEFGVSPSLPGIAGVIPAGHSNEGGGG